MSSLDPRTHEPISTYAPFYPAFVMWYVLGIEQFGGGGVFAQAVLRCRARVHEGLGNHRQTSIRDATLMDIEDKLGILDHVYPEAQRQAVTDNVGMERRRMSKCTR